MGCKCSKGIAKGAREAVIDDISVVTRSSSASDNDLYRMRSGNVSSKRLFRWDSGHGVEVRKTPVFGLNTPGFGGDNSILNSSSAD
jgi:hypothetical protein